MTLDAATQRTKTTLASGEGRLGLLVVFTDGVISFPLPDAGELIIGRAAGVELHVTDDSLSRRHAALKVERGEVQVRDLASQNGTKVNQKAVGADWQPLAIGDALQLGRVTAVLQRTAARRAQRRVWGHDYFEARLEDECEKAAGPFALVRLTVENGAAQQAAAAEAISRVLQSADTLAEYGAGELEVLLLNVAEPQAQDRADALVAALEPLGLPVRAGVACFPRDGRDANRLLSRACAEVLRPSPSPARGAQRPVVASASMRRLYQMVDRVAAGDISVLIFGETGVGKELIARALHDRSPRAKKPYLALNCGAFTETLLESELFGHERGAFTGANEARAGLFESTAGGTVFLDEVGELPAGTQVKLLRVLEEKAVRRVGANKTRPIDVRFVAATHRDLEADVKAGRFREDLYFRISAVTLAVPPLRERKDELEQLARAFCLQAAASMGKKSLQLSPQALDRLMAYSWPGNVRELRNVIERAVLLAEADQLEVQHLPVEKLGATWVDATPAPPAAPAPVPKGEAAAAREKIQRALEQCAGNQTQAAKLLGISRRTLLHRLDEYALPRPQKKPKG